MELKTPLYEEHVKLGGKIVPFGGYLLPVQYGPGLIKEHMAVRERAGLFDVSHMGEILCEVSSQCSMTVSSQCSMALVITMLQNSCHHNVPYRVITMLHGPCQHNAPEFFSSQCSIPCHHNAPWPLSSQCSRILVITMFHGRIITMLHGPCHDNAPEFFSSQ